MSLILRLGFLALLMSAARLVATDAPLWSTDLAEAQTRAGGRLLLVSFTGSDWNEWCKRLKEETLTKAHFLDYAKDHLVLVELDFPREKQLPPEQAKQNAAWVQKYAVTVYPTILLLNPAGTEVGRLSYMQGGPKTFVRELRRLSAPVAAPAPGNPRQAP